ncbi:MAG: glycosyltransferase [Flavobacteriales bacterium]|nr:glycosyltransferase [Flavobacteriales bacterium]
MSQSKKILFFTSRIPYPLEKGDKLRAYYQLKYLSKDAKIVLCCMSQEEITLKAETELKKFVDKIYVYRSNKVSTLINMLIAGVIGYPFQIGYFFNTGAHFYFKKVIQKEQPDHIFVQLIRMAEYVLKTQNISKSLDYMDTFSKGIERRMEKEKGLKQLAYRFEFNRLKKYEEKVFSYFDNHYIISSQDRDSFSFEKAKSISISPNGVDHNFFTPKKNISKSYDLVFTGNMSYPPNVSAVIYIAKEIMPLLIKDYPNIQLLIAGATPTSSVKGLANKNITVSGWIDDIRDAYNDSKIFLAPLQIGTGLQNKLLEAMSMELPCITSKLANNALGAKRESEILIGETPQEYVELIKRLINNEDLRNNLTKNAKLFVEQNYNWNSISKFLIKDFFPSN